MKNILMEGKQFFVKRWFLACRGRNMGRSVTWAEIDAVKDRLIGRDLLEVGGVPGNQYFRGPITSITVTTDEVIFERSWVAVSEGSGQSWKMCELVPASVSSKSVPLLLSNGEIQFNLHAFGMSFSIMRKRDNLRKPEGAR